nr:hypothetical protein [Candidatus Sigynarchaeota archaeon]
MVIYGLDLINKDVIPLAPPAKPQSPYPGHGLHVCTVDGTYPEDQHVPCPRLAR